MRIHLFSFFLAIQLWAIEGQVITEYSNQHVRGGHLQTQIQSEIACVNTCSVTSWCLAIDFVYSTQRPSCWFHAIATVCRPPTNLIGGKHLKFFDCYEGQHLGGGLLQGGLATIEDCVAGCHVLGSCGGVDFDFRDNSCWFHLGDNVCAPLVHKSSCTHLKRAKCTVQSNNLVSYSQPNIARDLGNYLVFNTPTVFGGEQVDVSLPQISVNAPGIARSQSSFPDHFSCGRPTVPPSGSRILGGEEVRPHSWPWMVALKNRKSRSVKCAGSIIATQWILTTAHCVDEDPDPKNWLVFIGAHDLMKVEPIRQRHTISAVILNHRFDVNTFDNDIALLKLTRPLDFNYGISHVCLPGFNREMAPGTSCVIAGWGVASHGKRPLKQATVPMVGLKTCRRRDWLGGEFTLTSRMMCAGYEDGGVDTCQGDSGGPLVCYIKSHWVQVGVTSFGRGCGLPRKPGVYTKVSRYIPWIQNTIRTY